MARPARPLTCDVVWLCGVLLYCVLAVYCAYTRLTDHRHHLVDVCTGSVLGTVLGVVSAGSLEFREEAEKKQS